MSESKQTTKSVNGPWFVVNMTKRWKQKKLVRGDKPTYIFKRLENAVAAASKLASVYPGHHWAVFECVGFFTQKLPEGVASVPLPSESAALVSAA